MILQCTIFRIVHHDHFVLFCFWPLISICFELSILTWVFHYMLYHHFSFVVCLCEALIIQFHCFLHVYTCTKYQSIGFWFRGGSHTKKPWDLKFSWGDNSTCLILPVVLVFKRRRKWHKGYVGLWKSMGTCLFCAVIIKITRIFCLYMTLNLATFSPHFRDTRCQKLRFILDWLACLFCISHDPYPV